MGTRTIGVAVPIPQPYASELQDLREEFGDPLARAIPAHVTLLGPTVVDDANLAEIDEHLRGVAAGEMPFEMRLRGSATFRPISPVVFVSVVMGISDCERLERAVRKGPLDRELRFPYHPHVTVAHDLPDEDLDRAFERCAGYAADFSVHGFSLYEHGRDGVWRPERDYVLGEGRTETAPHAAPMAG